MILALAVCTNLLPPLQAQVGQFGPIKNWKYIEYQNQQQLGPGKTNLLKTLLSGQTAVPQKNGSMLVKGMQLENYKLDGTTNLSATAPECLTDLDHHSVSSTGPLEVITANNQLSIRGRGFFCAYSNVVLIISNEVETTIQRGMIKPDSVSVARLTEPTPAAQLQAGAATNATMKIYSAFFEFIQASNTVNYTGGVRVEDPLLTLTCDTLVVLLTTNGAVDRIVAEGNVAIAAKTNPSRAQGERAVYQLREVQETILLTGNPATWNDGSRFGSGGQFIYEPKDNRLTAWNGSTVRVPRSDLHQPSLDLNRPTDAAKPPAPRTNELVQISASHMDFKLETTNRTGRSLLASNEVVIVSEPDQSRATGHQAVYSDTTGIFELQGDAAWESQNRIVRGQTLRFDRTNQVFTALHETFLRLPLSSLGGSLAVSQWFELTNAGPTTPRFVEVDAESSEYRGGTLQFQTNVAVRLLADENKVLGRINCHILTLSTNAEGHHVLAQGQVVLEQLPTLLPNGATIEKQLQCEQATMDVGTNGLVRSMIAQTNVVFRQTERHPEAEAPALTELSAQIVTAVFASHTNQVDSVVAEHNVVISQNTGGAKGDLAVYDRAKDSLLLSGDVTLESPRGVLNAPAAVLKHFGLWPGKLNRLNLPASGRTRPSANPNPTAPGSPRS